MLQNDQLELFLILLIIPNDYKTRIFRAIRLAQTDQSEVIADQL